MIRNAAPSRAVMHVGTAYPEAATINPVETEERQHGRKTSRRESFHELEDFVHVERMRELVSGLVSPVPVVEIAGDDERRVSWDQALYPLAQTFELQAALMERWEHVSHVPS